MIRLAPRDEILALNPFFAGDLVERQNFFFDPDGEVIAWHRPDDDASPEEQEEWAVWQGQQREVFEQVRDRVTLPPEFDGAGVEESLIVGADIPDIAVFPSLFGARCESLMREMGWEELFFLPLPRGPFWLSSRDDFAPLLASNTTLLALGADQEFAGGIIADADSAGTVFAALFWPVRCDTDYPMIFFSAPSAPFIGSICKHGNLHLDIGDAAYVARLRDAVLRAGLLVSGQCHEPFSEDGSIEGRRLIID